MALRLLEIIIPEEYANGVTAMLAEDGVTDYWQTCGCESKVVFRIIMGAEATEAMMDKLEKRYGNLDDLRIILLPLEASLPSPGEIEKKVEAARQNGDAGAVNPLRVSRQELYNDIFDSARLNRVYLVMVVLSAIVAAIGLLKNNMAVIIGAMVIAPLLGPNVALSLAITLGDIELGLRALKTNISGIVVAFLIATLLGALLPVDPAIPEIASRTVVGAADIVLALAAGIAGALAFTSGVPAALIGVMVAVALIPPLVVCGLLAGSGQGTLALEALLLLLINLVCVSGSGVATFLIQGIRPLNWWEADKARKATRLAMLSWILLLLAMLLLIYYKT